ncbi:MAG: sugar fermentation stimulation protein [Pelagibacteraceae bacterium BACL5 MAG-120705-bin12]|jgi:sugar fermentation stimulation protein A|nr:MAG: sugar fermentation stimulation protein [Pelagibacteraceae bacterium BACL5 MAG-121015-bin10]KRO60400.1 MAG: sugar fermentation stimulation protein [Pelagibacteraceae bacterium BACL5 MAG-121128-bin54]KRO60895.1 MAG: sugar fermentation stimulation protein [Pelagibacteraceae bacterium BACL5 MAG-120705-bin12]KRO64898.1 MAG: sugar fermentation stimulation protein [Pelagibacteraceae bacterium BACL5 MAG-120820-bin39]
MEFTKSLVKGKLIKRYKRFFADIKLNKEVVTAHCPNTGSMMGLLNEGSEVYLLKNDDPKRKLKYGLEIIKSRNNLVGVNTHMANKIAHHGLKNNLIKELKNNENIKPEVFFNKETRFDFLIEKNKQKIFMEVKNVTLFRDKNTAEFPDAITSRGSKHLLTLIDAIKQGYKSYLLFLVQIENMEYFRIAKDIDSEYYNNYLIAKKAGVNFLAYRCKINSKEIFIDKKLKIINE